MNSAQQRLRCFFSKTGFNPIKVEPLTADVSTRMFFRVWEDEGSLIACVYPIDEAGKAQFEAYLDVTNLFLSAKLPVARIFAFDGENLVIAHEDFGDLTLADKLLKSNPLQREEILDEAVNLIVRIQSATSLAYELNSVASRLKFDTEKLLWELNFFTEHYFKNFLGKPLADEKMTVLCKEFLWLCEELEKKASVLTHRDYHSSNLMFFNGEIKIIDHQDARIGPVSYDLVSLLLDRITEMPSEEWLSEKRKRFLEKREKLGLERIDEDSFTEEFYLQAIQRCLKAIGTFSYQIALRKRLSYRIFIKPMLGVVLRICERFSRLSTLKELLAKSLVD